MSFETRQDAYRWSETNRPQGPCGVLIAAGGFTHAFLLEQDQAQSELVYLGMRPGGAGRATRSAAR